jgi:hypothetical protein
MNDVIFSSTALAEYMAWQNEDRKTLRKIGWYMRATEIIIYESFPAKGTMRISIL